MNPQETKLLERVVRKLTKRELRDVAKHHAPHLHKAEDDTPEGKPNAPLGFEGAAQPGTPANENAGFAAREDARRAVMPSSKGR